MRLPSHHLELLSPARDAAIAREAILHGADAVYIGGPGFGARHNASNSLRDIAELVPFAHRFGAKVFVTLNTILHDDELEPAQRLITDLYQTGVDALIVQDMGVLEMDIPPIELHASTQCDIRSVEKAKFLSDAGFTQIVLARELNLNQIRDIRQATDATIEFFIHGALCVAYSGQCNISCSDRAQCQPRRLLTSLPSAIYAERRSGARGRFRKTPSVDERQRPDGQPGGTDRRGRAILQN
jgi:putative protease